MHWTFHVLCAAGLQAALGLHDMALHSPDVIAELSDPSDPPHLDNHVLLLQSVKVLHRGNASLATAVNEVGNASHASQTAAVNALGIIGIIVACFVFTSLWYFLILTALTHGAPQEVVSGTPLESEEETRLNEPLDEDMYALAVVSLIRDVQVITRGGKSQVPLHSLRVLAFIGILFGTIALQAGLVVQIKMFVTPQAVTKIRNAYDKYEVLMYGNQSNHTYTISTGRRRGIPQYFNASLFDTLDFTIQSAVCNIPFSQLSFFMLVLLIWSLTCVGQLKRCVETGTSLLYATPTVQSMCGALCGTGADADDDGANECVIVGLTPLVKAAILLLVLLPWVGLTCFLLWLGSRWLAATNNFGDLVLNAVALEFVLVLKDLIYVTLVAERNKRELRNTLVLPLMKKEPAGYVVFLGALAWGVLAVAWVFVYVYKLQVVLPEYKWDVHAACTPWLKNYLNRPPPPLSASLN